jgi:hypothetical protein
VKAGELVAALGGAAEAVAKAIEETAGPLAEMLEGKATIVAKRVEQRAAPLAEAVGVTVGTLAKSVEEKAGPLAETVSTAVDALAEDLEARVEQARKDVTASVKNFKFGQREGLILGLTVGVFAAVWLIRKIDREAAAERLCTAGARVGERTHALSGRVGEATHGLTSRVGEATQGLAGKAGALAGQAGERVGQVVQQVRSRAEQGAPDQAGQEVQAAKLRLSDPTSPAREITIGEAPKPATVESDLTEDTRTAIDEVVNETARAAQQGEKLVLSNGMKVVAFDGTDIGRVQEVREDVFVLDRPKGSDLLVPMDQVARIEGTVAYLRIDVGQLPKMGWDNA